MASSGDRHGAQDIGIEVSPAARTALQGYLDAGAHDYVRISPFNAAGTLPQWSLMLTGTADDDDVVVESAGLRFCLKPAAAERLGHCTVDLKQENGGVAFVVEASA